MRRLGRNVGQRVAQAADGRENEKKAGPYRPSFGTNEDESILRLDGSFGAYSFRLSLTWTLDTSIFSSFTFKHGEKCAKADAREQDDQRSYTEDCHCRAPPIVQPEFVRQVGNNSEHAAHPDNCR